jgi:hypothetical protein
MGGRAYASVAATVAAVLALAGGAAAAPAGVHAPSRSARSAILRALVRQDGTTAGVTAVYVANVDHRLSAVCVSTPDAGRVAFLFRASGRAWRYLLETGAARTGTRAERTLERACAG